MMSSESLRWSKLTTKMLRLQNSSGFKMENFTSVNDEENPIQPAANWCQQYLQMIKTAIEDKTWRLATDKDVIWSKISAQKRSTSASLSAIEKKKTN